MTLDSPASAGQANPAKPPLEPEPESLPAHYTPTLLDTTNLNQASRLINSLDMSYLTSNFSAFGPPALGGPGGWLPSGSGSSTGHSQSASTAPTYRTIGPNGLNLPSPVFAKQPLPIHSAYSPPNDLPDLVPDNGMSPPEHSPFQSFADPSSSYPRPGPPHRSVSDQWRHHNQPQNTQPYYSSHPLPLSIAPSSSAITPFPGYQLSTVSRPAYQGVNAGREVGYTGQDELFSRAQTDDYSSAKRPVQQAWAAGIGSPQDEVRNTVSPQEAFLDYDDQSHRLQDAGLGAQSSLFASLPAAHPSLAPIPVSFSPPSARSSFSSHDRYSVSPGSGLRLSPRMRPSTSPVSGWHQPAPARKSHPFSVPQNAVSWNEHDDNDSAIHNDFDDFEETPLAAAFDMDPFFPNLELEPIPVMGHGHQFDRDQSEYQRSLQLDHTNFNQVQYSHPNSAPPRSPALKTEQPPLPMVGATEWTATHPRRSAAQSAITLLQQRLSDSDPFGEEDDEEEQGRKVVRRRKPKKEALDAHADDGGDYTPARSSRPDSPKQSIAPLPALPDPSLSASRKRSPPAAFDDDDSLSSLPDEDDHDRDADFSDADAEGDLDPDHHPDPDDDGSSPQAHHPRRRSHKAVQHSTLQPNKRRRRIPVATHGQIPAGALRCVLPAVAEEGVGHGVCGVVFRRPYDLARHKETIHGVGNGDKAPRKSDWKCGECDGMFSRKDALIRHARIRGHDAGIQ